MKSRNKKTYRKEWYYQRWKSSSRTKRVRKRQIKRFLLKNFVVLFSKRKESLSNDCSLLEDTVRSSTRLKQTKRKNLLLIVLLLSTEFYLLKNIRRPHLQQHTSRQVSATTARNSKIKQIDLKSACLRSISSSIAFTYSNSVSLRESKTPDQRTRHQRFTSASPHTRRLIYLRNVLLDLQRSNSYSFSDSQVLDSVRSSPTASTFPNSQKNNDLFNLNRERPTRSFKSSSPESNLSVNSYTYENYQRGGGNKHSRIVVGNKSAALAGNPASPLFVQHTTDMIENTKKSNLNSDSSGNNLTEANILRNSSKVI